jgi:hypothetical protein
LVGYKVLHVAHKNSKRDHDFVNAPYAATGLAVSKLAQKGNLAGRRHRRTNPHQESSQQEMLILGSIEKGKTAAKIKNVLQVNTVFPPNGISGPTPNTASCKRSTKQNADQGALLDCVKLELGSNRFQIPADYPDVPASDEAPKSNDRRNCPNPKKAIR